MLSVIDQIIGSGHEHADMFVGLFSDSNVEVADAFRVTINLQPTTIIHYILRPLEATHPITPPPQIIFTSV